MRNMALLFLMVYWVAAFAGMPDPLEYENYVANNTTALHSAMSLLNQAKQLQNQLQLIQYQMKNTGKVSRYQWRNIATLTQQLDAITRQGQSLSYAASNLDQQFRRKYPNYTQSPYGQTNYPQAYKRWNSTTLDTLRSTLDAAGMSASDFQTEQETLHQLTLQGQSAQGRMQVLQVSSEIAAQNVNQLQELKRIMIAQTNAQNAYMAYQVSKESYNEKNLEDIDEHISSEFPRYHDNPKLGYIPAM